MSPPPELEDDLYREANDALMTDLLHTTNKSTTTQVVNGGDECNALADGFRPTDVGNASRLVATANGTARYAAAWGKWLVYKDGVWIIDSSEALITEMAKNVASRLFKLAINLPAKDRDDMWKFAIRCEQAGPIRDMLRLARGIPGVLVDVKDLDADPWILNVANGTVDLRTGRLRPHNPDDLCTMQAPVSHDDTATCPTWTHCIETWQPDPAVRAMLQRATGSGITGLPLEYLFVNVGGGGNGKSKFFGGVADVLGPFCVTPHKSLLVASKHDAHPTHVASLFRARTLIAPETSQDDRLDEELVKALTGGDDLRARRMREDEWTFKPTHTAFIHTNYRPRIRGTDEGIWRRLRLIPWSVTIPAEHRDEHLADKLRNESSGILNWLIAGALDMLHNGLAEPESVRQATNAYRNDEDHIGKFLSECMTIDDAMMITAKDLRATYETWCNDIGETPWSTTRFGRSLKFDKVRIGSPSQLTYLGLGVQ